MSRKYIQREKRACVMCGRVGTTGIKPSTGMCRKRKACVMRACDRVFRDPPPKVGDMVYLGSIAQGVKLWGVQGDSAPASMQATLVFDNEPVKTLQGEMSLTIPFQSVDDLDHDVLQAILGPGDKI